MANFTLQAFYTQLNVICNVSSDDGEFPKDSSFGFANEGLRLAKRMGVEFPSREFSAQMSLLSGIYRYAAPTGMEDMIGIFDQIQIPDRLNFSRKDASVFRRDFPGNENIYAIDRNKLTKSLLINLVTIQLSTPQIDDTSSLTTNGTWAAVSGTDATNLAVDTIHFPESRSGIKFDIDISQSAADAASVEKTDLPAVDLSAAQVKQVGTLTLEFYWPSATLPTSIVVRFGSSSSAYYSITATTQIDGQAFVQGLNQIGLDWTDVSPTGSPDNTSITYLRFTANFPSSLSSDVLGVAFSNLVMREKMFVDVRFLSDYLVMDDDGSTLKSSFDDQNDTSSYLLVDEAFWDWLIYHTGERLFTFYEPDEIKRREMEKSRDKAEDALALKSPSRRDAPGQTWMDTEDLQPFLN